MIHGWRRLEHARDSLATRTEESIIDGVIAVWLDCWDGGARTAAWPSRPQRGARVRYVVSVPRRDGRTVRSVSVRIGPYRSCCLSAIRNQC